MAALGAEAATGESALRQLAQEPTGEVAPAALSDTGWAGLGVAWWEAAVWSIR